MLKTIKIKKQEWFNNSCFLLTDPGIEPGIPPWEGDVLTAWPIGLNNFNNISKTQIFCKTYSYLFFEEAPFIAFKKSDNSLLTFVLL